MRRKSYRVARFRVAHPPHTKILSIPVNKYLAIIKDSFREALASRVLWLLLVLITLLLLVIAPLGYHQVVTWQLSDNDVRGWENLMHKVRTEGRKDEPSPSRRIFVSLDEKLQDRLVKVKLPGIDEEVRPIRVHGCRR